MSTVANNGDSKELSLSARKLQLQNEEPPIPHILSNYVTLFHITSNLVLHSYSELQNLMETLPSVTSDLTRKRRLLEYIIKSRQEFVKLYVLMKWSSVWKEISKCIDVVSWLNGQQNCYTNVINVLFNIERTLGGAKLRNPDLQTALEVLKNGQPTQTSFDFIPLQKLSPNLIIDTLQDLNVLLSMRLALVEQLPSRFRNYTISNGRVKFVVPNSFSLDLGIADRSTDARLFLIDFGFEFEGAHQVSLEVRAKVEATVNEKLAKQPLSEVLNWVLKFSQSYKLSTIHERLTDLERGLWAGVLKHLFYADRSIIAIQYWTGLPGQRNIIELGILKTLDLGVQWVREGKLITDHGIQFGTENLDPEVLINEVIVLHTSYIVESVYSDLKLAMSKGVKDSDDQQQQQSSEEGVLSLVRPNKIWLQLTGSRNTVFLIDQLTGRIALRNPNQIIQSAERSLNDLPDRAKHAASILLKLRDLSLQEEVANRAMATGWVVNSSISISQDEIRKYFPSDTKLVLCLRLPSWSYRWYLLVTVGGCSPPRWWLSQLESKDNVHAIRYLESVTLARSRAHSYDYRLFDDLKSFTTTRIKVQSICRELDSKEVKYSLLQRQSDSGPGSPVLIINLHTLLESSWAQSSLIVSSLSSPPNSLLVQGRTKQKLSLVDMSSADSGVVFDSDSGRFSMTIGETEATTGLVETIQHRLGRIERVVSCVEMVESQKLTLVSADMSRVVFEYDKQQKVNILFGSDSAGKSNGDANNVNATAKIGSSGDSGSSTDANRSVLNGDISTIQLDGQNPQHLVLPLLQATLARDGLLPVIWLLKNTLPLYEAIAQIQSSTAMIMVYPHTVTDIRLNLLSYSVQLELKVVKRNGRAVEVFVSEVLQTPKQPTDALKPLWETRQSDLPGCIPLQTGLGCPIDKIGLVLDRVTSLLTTNNL